MWQPSPAYPPAPLSPPPSNALKTFGILGIVFAALNAVGNALSIVQATVHSSAFDSADMPSAIPNIDGMRAVLAASNRLSIGTGLVMLVMDAALIAIGVHLLKRSELGRKLAVVWASVALVVLIGRAVAFEVLLLPSVNRLMTDTMNGLGQSKLPFDSGFFSLAARAGTYVSLGFMALFPVALLVTMNLPSVKRSVVGAGESPGQR